MLIRIIFHETNVPAEYYESLSRALASLHSLPPREFENIGVEILSAHELRATMKQRMVRVKEQYDINKYLWERWQTWLAEDSHWPSFVGVKHWRPTSRSYHNRSEQLCNGFN